MQTDVASLKFRLYVTGHLTNSMYDFVVYHIVRETDLSGSSCVLGRCVMCITVAWQSPMFAQRLQASSCLRHLDSVYRLTQDRGSVLLTRATPLAVSTICVAFRKMAKSKYTLSCKQLTYCNIIVCMQQTLELRHKFWPPPMMPAFLYVESIYSQRQPLARLGRRFDMPDDMCDK